MSAYINCFYIITVTNIFQVVKIAANAIIFISVAFK